jgi:hypothetical protein
MKLGSFLIVGEWMTTTFSFCVLIVYWLSIAWLFRMFCIHGLVVVVVIKMMMQRWLRLCLMCSRLKYGSGF